jgi:hypothetical protein
VRRRRAATVAVAIAALTPALAASCGDAESSAASAPQGGQVYVPPYEAGMFDAFVDGPSDGGGGANAGGHAQGGAASGGGGAGGGGLGGLGGGGASGGAGGAGGATTGGGGAGGFEGVGGCDTTLGAWPLEPGIHEPICSPITWPTNPPSSGEHYPIWAAYKVYTSPVPRGFYVHDLEHGGIVMLYNCPGGCDAEVAALVAHLDARPADPVCTEVRNRYTVTPDPLIPTRFAAAAWGYTLTSDCFDLAALDAFIDAHYSNGPELVCSDGFDPTAPDAGIPPDCGDPPDGG